LSFRPKGEISSTPPQAASQIAATSTTPVISTKGRNPHHPTAGGNPDRCHFARPCHFDQREKSPSPHRRQQFRSLSLQPPLSFRPKGEISAIPSQEENQMNQDAS
jgi:hypothetical protein